MATFSLGQSFAVQQNGYTSNTIDGEVIIVNLKNGVYYSLTEVAADVWHFLQSRLSVGQILEAIQAQYQEDVAKISDWLISFLRELQEEDLLIPAPPSGTPSPRIVPGLKAKGPFVPSRLRKYTDIKDMVVMSRIGYDDISLTDTVCKAPTDLPSRKNSE